MTVGRRDYALPFACTSYAPASPGIFERLPATSDGVGDGMDLGTPSTASTARSCGVRQCLYPLERVFMCGVYEFSGSLVLRFAVARFTFSAARRPLRSDGLRQHAGGRDARHEKVAMSEVKSPKSARWPKAATASHRHRHPVHPNPRALRPQHITSKCQDPGIKAVYRAARSARTLRAAGFTPASEADF